MKLSCLYESNSPADVMRGMGLRYFKKLQDPARSSFYGRKNFPIRSGSQDTPLKPRHRLYFNAPIGATQGKIGFKKHGSLGLDMISKGYFQKKGKAAMS